MSRFSILSWLLLVVVLAIVFALVARLQNETFFYVTGPLLGATLAVCAYRRDRSALVTGGAVGGLPEL